MDRSDLVIEVRDVNLVRVDVVNPIEATFSPRHLGVGAWELTIPADDRTADALRAPGSGVVVSAPWGTVMSGPRTGYLLTQSGSDPVGRLKVTGEDDKCLLWSHMIYPDPAHAATAQTAGYYSGSVVAETLMHALVNLNAGPGAHSSRRSTLEGKITLSADGGRGSAYPINARFDNLGETLATIAAQNGLAFGLVQDGSVLRFTTSEVADRSDLIRLDVGNGTLSSLSSQESAPTLTASHVAGQGEGVDRAIRVVRDAAAEAAWGRVIETFRDRRDTDDSAVLDQAGAEDIADGAWAVVPKVVPTEAMSMQYGVDWREGDLIAVGPDETKETVTGAVIRVTRTSVRTAAKVGK